MSELTEQDATLAVVGTHGHSRMSEILLGGVVGELLHDAPCSVLVARPPRGRGAVPARDRRRCGRLAQVAAAVAAAQYLARALLGTADGHHRARR